ncbi:hypothetical protein [Haloplanus sp. C73]|uniref:hypothetical protein n=1 Tax=Haloplanus sp. C73 TaxID=3421641 RepID=UPI003EB8319A
MYETQYILLFLAGVLLTTGAWTDRATGFCAGAGVFVWLVIGFSSMALVAGDGAGGTDVYASTALAWLCFGNSAMHVIRLGIHIHDQLKDADEDAAALDPTQALDQSDTQTPQP